MNLKNIKFSKYKDQRVTVLWSGGLDSTYLMIALAEAGAKVTALSVVNPTLPNANHEKIARVQAIEWLNKNKNDVAYRIDHVTNDLVLGDGGRGLMSRGIHWKQMQMWAVVTVTMIAQDANTVFMGVVRDDGWYNETLELEKVVRSFDWNIKEEARPTLEFPIKNVYKYEILQWFSKNGYSELVKHITYCSNTINAAGRILACGKCPSCSDAIKSKVEHQPRWTLGNTIDQLIQIGHHKARGYHAVYRDRGEGLYDLYIKLTKGTELSFPTFKQGETRDFGTISEKASNYIYLGISNRNPDRLEELGFSIDSSKAEPYPLNQKDVKRAAPFYILENDVDTSEYTLTFRSKKEEVKDDG